MFLFVFVRVFWSFSFVRKHTRTNTKVQSYWVASWTGIRARKSHSFPSIPDTMEFRCQFKKKGNQHVELCHQISKGIVYSEWCWEPWVLQIRHTLREQQEAAKMALLCRTTGAIPHHLAPFSFFHKVPLICWIKV